jgi:hypothetical protein
MISNPHLQHTLLIYAIIMAFYTFAVFCVPFNRQNAPVFLERRMKPISTIAWIHANFLLVLLAAMLFASIIAPPLPNWMTRELFRGRGTAVSASVILCWIFFPALLLIERASLWASGASDSDGEDDRS